MLFRAGAKQLLLGGKLRTGHLLLRREFCSWLPDWIYGLQRLYALLWDRHVGGRGSRFRVDVFLRDRYERRCLLHRGLFSQRTIHCYVHFGR